MTEFVLATANFDKAREIAEVLGDTVMLRPRPPDIPEVMETGDSLTENARLKARALVEATGLPAIADDTGLEVDALGGAPGVMSARFAGEGASYSQNVDKLLRSLAGVPPPRPARFRTIALALWPDGTEIVAEGTVEGVIADAAKGTGGFGYDPVFVADGARGRTFAELSAAEKNRISHRGAAFEKLKSRLLEVRDNTNAQGRG